MGSMALGALRGILLVLIFSHRRTSRREISQHQEYQDSDIHDFMVQTHLNQVCSVWSNQCQTKSIP